MARGSTEGLWGLWRLAYPAGQRPQVGQDLTAVHAPPQEVTTAGLKASTAQRPDTRPHHALPGQSLLERGGSWRPGGFSAGGPHGTPS